MHHTKTPKRCDTSMNKSLSDVLHTHNVATSSKHASPKPRRKRKSGKPSSQVSKLVPTTKRKTHRADLQPNKRRLNSLHTKDKEQAQHAKNQEEQEDQKDQNKTQEEQEDQKEQNKTQEEQEEQEDNEEQNDQVEVEKLDLPKDFVVQTFELPRLVSSTRFASMVMKSSAYVEITDMPPSKLSELMVLLNAKCAASVQDFYNPAKRILTPHYAVQKLKGKTYIMLPLFFAFHEGWQFGSVQDLRRVELAKMPSRICVKKEFALRDYQEQALAKAFEFLTSPPCFATTMVQPCGAGKTLQFGWLVGKLGVRTIIVVPLIRIAEQTKDELINVLNIKEDDIQLVGSEFEAPKMGAWVYVAVYNSAMTTESKETNYRDIIASCDFLVVDECHRFPSKSFKTIGKYFTGKYRLGVTATPERNDGAANLIFGLLGPISSEVRRVLPPPGLWNVSMLDYHNQAHAQDIMMKRCGKHPRRDKVRMVARLCSDRERIESIGDFILENIPGDALVLADHKVFVAMLVEYLNSKKPNSAFSYVGGQGKSKKKTEAITHAFETTPYIVATTAKASEALNVPRLNYLVLCTPLSPGRVLTQSSGRILRLKGHKKYTYYVRDTASLIYTQKADMCTTWFKSQGYTVLPSIPINQAAKLEHAKKQTLKSQASQAGRASQDNQEIKVKRLAFKNISRFFKQSQLTKLT